MGRPVKECGFCRRSREWGPYCRYCTHGIGSACSCPTGLCSCSYADEDQAAAGDGCLLPLLAVALAAAGLVRALERLAPARTR
jgi:hypothetical protein